MSQSLLHKLFGIGGIPNYSRAKLEAEGIVFKEEGVWASVSRESRRVWNMTVFLGSFVLTKKRFVVYSRMIAPFSAVIDVPLETITRESFHVSVDGKKVNVEFNVPDSSHSGRWIFRFRSTTHSTLADCLNELQQSNIG